MVHGNAADGGLRFTTDVVAAVPHGRLQSIGVGTPPDEDGSGDLQYVWAAVLSIGEHMTDDKVMVDRVEADIERVPHGLPLRILLPRETRTASLTSHEPSQLPPALRLSLSPGCQDAGLQWPRYGHRPAGADCGRGGER